MKIEVNCRISTMKAFVSYCTKLKELQERLDLLSVFLSLLHVATYATLYASIQRCNIYSCSQ